MSKAAGLRSALGARHFSGGAWLVSAALAGVASSATIGACSSSASKTTAPEGGAGYDGAGAVAAGGVAAGGETGESGGTAAGGEGGSGGAIAAGAGGGGAGGAAQAGGAGGAAQAGGAGGAGGADVGSRADLSAAQVTWIGRYPTLSGAISSPLSAVVGPDIEFPNLQNTALAGYYLAAADVDVGSSSIDIQLNQTLTFPQATFNGYDLSFAPSPGEELPTIKSVSINSATTADLAQAHVTFNATAVYVNFAGLSCTTSSRLLIDIGF